MILSPDLALFVKTIVLPLAATGFALYQIGRVQKTLTQIIFAMIRLDIKKGNYDADDLLELGVIELAQSHLFDSAEAFRILTGVIK